MLQIIIQGRGGQGAQTAGDLLARAFFAEGREVQSFATYGGARRGTPVSSFIRVDDRPIRVRCDIERADAILCINMVHISPWAATVGLMRGAGRLLEAGAPLYLYGAYRQAGVETAPSNEAFDADLRARNPEWGVRALEDVIAEAEGRGLALDSVTPMPANNLSVVFRKA